MSRCHIDNERQDTDSTWQNWFQNRRAKVKQDAKKHMNALQLFQATLAQHSQQYLTHPPPAPSGLPHYYGPLPVVPSNTESVTEGQAAPQAIITTQSPNTLQATMSSSRDGTFVPVTEFSMPPTMTNEPHGLAFDAQAFPPDMAGPPVLLQDFNLGPSLSQDFMAMQDNYDMFMQQAGNTPMSMDSMPNGAVFTPPSGSASPNTMPSLTSAYSHPSQSEDEKPLFIVDSPFDNADVSIPTGHPTPAESTSAWSSVAYGQDVYEQQNASAPALALSQDSPTSAASFERRESSALAESMDSVSTDHSSPDSESSFKAPSQVSSLAARRQKPRPANLVSTALRSASYSAGMPGSPGANTNPITQDSLRRIRSHGIPNGRISKPSGPQKSPMHANFDAAAIVSPKFARHTSNYSVSTINSSGPLTATTMPGSLAPPTPITPNEFSRFPISQVPGLFFPNGSPGAFSHTGEDAIYLDASSPMAKLDMQQMEQYRANFVARHEASLFHTPPQSAPATQQHFGFTPPGMQPRQLMNAPSHMGHARKRSLPNANHGMEQNLQFQPQLIMHPGHGIQHQFSGHPAEAFNADFNGFPTPHGLPIHGDGMRDVGFQFMVPQPVETSTDSRLPVHFHNQTPEDFQNAARPK
jgi:hypothetical protein